MDYQNKQAVNVRQELFLKCFSKVNAMGNAKQLPINVINGDHCIVGMYYPINAYDKLDKKIDELKKEIKKLGLLRTAKYNTPHFLKIMVKFIRSTVVHLL